MKLNWIFVSLFQKEVQSQVPDYKLLVAHNVSTIALCDDCRREKSDLPKRESMPKHAHRPLHERLSGKGATLCRFSINLLSY